MLIARKLIGWTKMAQSECNCQLIYEVLEETEPFKF